MSADLTTIWIVVAIGALVFIIIDKFGFRKEEYEAKMDDVESEMKLALELSKECLTEAKETNRLLEEIKELLEKK